MAGSLVREPSSCLTGGDGAVAGVGHGIVEVADGLVGEFMLRIRLVLFGDALLPVDVPPLQVCRGVGYLRPDQSNGMPFRWQRTATWANAYSFAFLDE